MTGKRIGFVGIIISDRRTAAVRVNEVLTEKGDIIVGRMGIPCLDEGCNVITLIVRGTTDDVGSLTGKLGMIEGVTVKSAMAK